MSTFVQRHRESVIGMLNGFDRIRFRGTLRWLSYAAGLGRHLSAIGVRLVQFKEFTESVTARVRQSIEGVAKAAGRPFEYLSKPSMSKEDHARAIAKRDGIRDGLIGVFSTVEPCKSFRIGRDSSERIEIFNAQRKCLHYYVYWLDAEWGFCHVRVQTWLPLTIHICVNGRERLQQQMDRVGLGYRRRDNCFVWVQDLQRAQGLLDEQLHTDWVGSLQRLLRQSHPAYAQIVDLERSAGYYWSANQSEWASDVLFRSPAALHRLYPSLIQPRHAKLRKCRRAAVPGPEGSGRRSGASQIQRRSGQRPA